MELKKKFTQKQALKELQDIKTKILGENVLGLLESDDVKEEIENVEPGKYLIAAVMAGLVFYDDENKCLVQNFINPVKSGEQEADSLYYKNNLTLGIMREEHTSNNYALTINLITRITGRTKQIVEKVFGQDLQIMQEIASFFYA
jgi:hypothetical protein